MEQCIKEAMFYERRKNGVQCLLCPHFCFLEEGIRGKCRARQNIGGRLHTLVYGLPSAVNIDPIEKKPFFHLLPGSWAYSFAAPGCSLSCSWCQNWQISQAMPGDFAAAEVPSYLEPAGGGRLRIISSKLRHIPPEMLVRNAMNCLCKSIAFTYTEPAVSYEYMLDAARLAKEKGLKTVMISSGYINRKPMEQLLPYMDAVKIDLKCFKDETYRQYCCASLEPVKNTLRLLKENKKLFEIVNLLIPGLNDSEEEIREMSSWICGELGKDSILFFSRFFPNYQMQSFPPEEIGRIMRAREISMSAGLRYVYSGNVPGNEGENTFCGSCGKMLIERRGYTIINDLLSGSGGKCPFCGESVPGIWQDS
ncbi:MAG: AmmeMemoRadiSam system radical SAM enzyme [Elusimicrobiales bacterium]|nr:AmmeMemoRadiSam system radical SAM enzyme [Elusimicrobiales bacterium]